MGMFSVPFWQAALERAIRTGASAALGMVGSHLVITDIPWSATVGAVALAVAIDLLTSIAGTSPITPGEPGDGPSLTPVETVDHDDGGAA